MDGISTIVCMFEELVNVQVSYISSRPAVWILDFHSTDPTGMAYSSSIQDDLVTSFMVFPAHDIAHITISPVQMWEITHMASRFTGGRWFTELYCGNRFYVRMV